MCSSVSTRCAALVGREGHLEVLAVRAADDLAVLVTDADAQHPRSVLVHDVGVRLDHAADDGLALAQHGLDDQPVGRHGGRVGGEDDAGLLRGDHLLDDDGDGRLVLELSVGPVGDDPLAVQRGPAVPDLLEQVGSSHHVGEGRVHAGEGGVAGVLGGAGRTHGDAHGVAELRVGLEHRVRDGLGDRGLADQALGLGRCRRQRLRVGRVGRGHQLAELLARAGGSMLSR